MIGDEWASDKLSRKGDSEYLTRYLTNKYAVSGDQSRYSSFVLNVNAEWGFGKTYFLQNWADSLLMQKHAVIYFDAWKNDFTSEPLLAFIHEFTVQLQPVIKEISPARTKLTRAMSEAKKLIRPSVPFLLSIIAKKLTGFSLSELTEEIGVHGATAETNHNIEDHRNRKTAADVVEAVVLQSAAEALKQHKTMQDSIADFRLRMEELIALLGKHTEKIKLPIFVLVDELDRCRPTYAIELLEGIKHLFGVKGVFFVVATDSRELAHSVRAVYGTDFGSERYLKRFFDQEYNLSMPNRSAYCQYLLRKYNLDTEERLFFPRVLGNGQVDLHGGCLVSLAHFSEYFNLGLRDAEQLCIVLDGITRTTTGILHVAFLIYLIGLYIKHRDLFDSSSRLWAPSDSKETSKRQFPQDLNFDSCKASPDGMGQQHSHLSTADLINFYFGFSRENDHNERNRMPGSDLLLRVIVDKAHNQSGWIPLRSYSELVMRAGQFSR